MSSSLVHMQAYRQRKADGGYCARGGCWAQRGNTTYCEYHRLQAAADGRRLTELLRLQKQCGHPDCGNTPRHGGSMCGTHSTKSAASWRKRRKAKAQGLCPYCGKPVVKGLTTCSHHREAQTIRVKVLQHARRESGLCFQCATPADKGHTLCGKHLLKLREAYRRRTR